ncbi:MAG TPA: carboxypeptidase-like regulatory domain-containing protein [Gemmatimonadaceae bacterium]|nr:carboxypeptidase-like regulatory domain-containing protein [Gemmatimonadaceae bacterium]
MHRLVARLARALCAATVPLLSPLLATAQPPAESGIARDMRTRAPLACLHVALVDSSQRAVAHTVTDSGGTFVLVAPSAGIYRVAFEVFGWEQLLGPVDTLRDGEMREREYPLEFGELPASGGQTLAELRRLETGDWRSAAAANPDADIRFPKSMRGAATSGDVLAEYVVDERGRVRPESWRPIASTNPDFLAAVRAHVPVMRYQPARLNGRPSCQLVRNQVRFEWVGPMPAVTLLN